MQKILNVPVMWTIAQAVTETGLTEFTVRQLVKAKRIHSIRLGAGKNGKILLNAESLCNYLQGDISGADKSHETTGDRIKPIPVNL